MNTKRLQYEEIEWQRYFIWLKNNESLTQQKYVILQ